jgi:uncharacterized membrane protein required for colicin V production
MTPADVLLLLFVGLGFAVGFLRGTVRALLAVGASALCFLLAAYIRVPLGDWLANNGSLDPFYAQMLAFGAVFLALFIALLLVIMFSRTPTSITSHPLVDDVVGGLIGAFAAVLVVAGLTVILASFYGNADVAAAGESGLVAEIYSALSGSGIATSIQTTVVPWMAFLLGPVIPSEVLAAMA